MTATAVGQFEANVGSLILFFCHSIEVSKVEKPVARWRYRRLKISANEIEKIADVQRCNVVSFIVCGYR